MEAFDPIRHIAGSSTILESDGTWPSFYESEVHSFNFYRGDFQPEDDYVSAEIVASIELASNEFPYIVDLKFHDCASIEMSGFNHHNVIEELIFSFEERGFYADGVKPLPPFICVKIGEPNRTATLSFKCFKIEVLGRRNLPPK